VATGSASLSGSAVERHPPSLKVSRYDRVAAWLVSLLVLVGLTATVLFIIWLTSVLVLRRVSKPIQMIQYPGRGDHAEGFERDAEPPGLEEVDIVLEQPSLEAALEAVTNLASTVAASADTFETDSLLTSRGSGRGDSRPPGPEGEGDNVVPPWERWEIRYTTASLEEYARQLDYFGIELGAVGGSKLIDYVYNLSRNPPSHRQGPSKEEKRVYLTWRSGTLREFDLQLLARAGVATQGRIVMQFIPEEVYNELHRLEFENAGDRPPTEWLRTIFGVRPAGRGFEFYIISQTFRSAPASR
jgi:hypothetical protein